VLVWKQSHC